MIEYLARYYPLAVAVLAVNLVLVGWVFFSIACRFQKMSRATDPVVGWQYMALGAGSVCAFAFQFAPQLRDWSITAALAGAVVFLMLSARRWRHGVPRGLQSAGGASTADMDTLPMEHWPHVSGGAKE